MSKAMREKYCSGHCSAGFIETGVPQIRRDRLEQAAKERAKLEREVAKADKKAERVAAKCYKKKCTSAKMPPAEKIVFC